MQFRLARAVFAQHSKGATDRGTAGILLKTGTLFEIPEGVRKSLAGRGEGLRFPRRRVDHPSPPASRTAYRLDGVARVRDALRDAPAAGRPREHRPVPNDRRRVLRRRLVAPVRPGRRSLAHLLDRQQRRPALSARRGVFDGPEGVFRGEDSHEGRPVLVTFRWDRRDPSRPVWQQAFSADGGRSWETNWFMYFRRAGG